MSRRYVAIWSRLNSLVDNRVCTQAQKIEEDFQGMQLINYLILIGTKRDL